MADDTTEHSVSGKVEHRETYVSFMTWMKWGVAVVAVVLILMAIFLVR